MHIPVHRVYSSEAMRAANSGQQAAGTLVGLLLLLSSNPLRNSGAAHIHRPLRPWDSSPAVDPPKTAPFHKKIAKYFCSTKSGFSKKIDLRARSPI
jgi:hypothetical protein